VRSAWYNVTMHFDVNERTILLVRHGSHAYGLNVPTSDEDFKGVCVKPKECYFGFTQRFEQMEHMGSKSDGVDKAIYSIDKFASLAADCNPNIIEVLHVADEDVIKCDVFGERLRDARDMFLSKKAKFTFSGYAHAQLKRIKTHRAWLLNPPKGEPTRAEFGLEQVSKVSKSEMGAFNSLLGLPTVDDEAIVSPMQQSIAIDLAAKNKLGIELPKNIITLFTQERAYNAARTHYEQYLNWVKSRNPARAELERKFGLDTKHAMHLCRLMKMCKEILSTGKVNVKRSDREELLAIRNGTWSYDRIVEFAENIEKECDQLYVTSTLPREPDRAKIDDLIVELTDEYLRLRG